MIAIVLLIQNPTTRGMSVNISARRVTFQRCHFSRHLAKHQGKYFQFPKPASSMAELFGAMLRRMIFLLALESVSAKRFSIMAPNVLHVGVEETVSVTVFDAPQSVTVKLYLQDYPLRRNTFSQVQVVLPPEKGSKEFLTVKVEPKDLPDINSLDKQYVYLVAKSADAHFQFHKEAKILLSYRDGMVFIQTDKPIYTPRQTVKIRVIPLKFDMKPSERKITVIVMNPQGIRVQQWKNLNTSTGIITEELKLNNFVIKGNWTITALYGHKNIHNTTVQFQVKEYVLPKFSVKLSVPPYILDTDELIKVTITATYTYGKPVVGVADIRLRIVEHSNGLDVPFPAIPPMSLDSRGAIVVEEKVEVIRHLLRAFPEKGRRRLLVQAEVIERATGNKETAVDNSCHFTSSPYLVEFKNTLKYFKPGLPFVVKVVVTYPNKQPAPSVPVKISATGIQENEKKDLKPNGKTISKDDTNEEGEAEFAVDSCAECQTIKITVETEGKGLKESQNAVANFIVKAFDSGNAPLIKVRQLDPPGKVDDKVKCEAQREGDEAPAVMSFVVVSRGEILLHDTTQFFGGSSTTSWSFLVSPEMSPSARLIGYYIDSNGQVAADSIALKIEDKLPTKVEFPDAFEVQSDGTRVQKNVIEKRPHRMYELKIKAPPGTRLGVLGVDKSVYLLRNENRLTEERIFKTVQELDLGCGVGGGEDSEDTFKNAGVVLITDNFKSDERNDYGCDKDGTRKKRSSEVDTDYKICCEMGKENGNVTCEKLDMDSNKGLDKNCREAFRKCCTEKYGTNDTTLLGRSIWGNENDDKVAIEQVDTRTDFPEAWIWHETVVGPDGYATLPRMMPNTITTWIMQAVAINNETGLGLATPFRIVARKDFFVSLKMPYSVKRGEQVSLLVTAFNYGKEKIKANIYIRGGEGFCSIAMDDQLALIGKVDIPPNDARSVAVPIVPKRTGEVEVEVASVVQSQWRNIADSVIRKLFVVPEGLEKSTSQSFVLDPKGILNDEANKPTADPSKTPTQNDTIKLRVPRKAIPGSIGAFVYLTGNLLGPVVNTTIEGGLEKFFRQPTGCGEQTMIKLAPNVYVLEYLMNTNQLSDANEEHAYRFIQSGYQGELNYRRDDKSFSAWGNDREGSTWLTAFVMRVFCKAQQFTGVNIDEDQVCESVSWLIENQRGDGALPEVYRVIHGEMVGGTYTEGDVAMTAFVLSALAECNCKGAASTASILLAKDYLEKQYKTLNKPYSMALTAYALALVDSQEKFNASDRLKQRAIYDNVRKTRHWNAGDNALNVETAGYALLTQVILKNNGYAGPIVTYLTNQRKGGIGFVSTQDTVVALQALALYSAKTAGNSLDLKVKLTIGDMNPPETRAVHITPENALLRTKFDVTKFLGENLYVESRGTGAGLLEVDIRYNLPSSRGEICKFDLKTIVKETKEKDGKLFGPQQNEAGQANDRPEKKKRQHKNRKSGKKGRGCKKLKTREEKRRCRNKDKGKVNTPQKYEPVESIDLKVCTRYKETGSTGMAILDIGILTGFKLDEESHAKLKKNDTLPELDSFEVSDRSLVLYLSEIPSDRELCVDVRFKRKYHVGAVQAVPVNVYDYYKPEQSCSKFYGPDKLSPLKLGVCEVGSSSCKCTQDECAQKDPYIDNIKKLSRLTCKNYHYAVKGKLLLIDEDNTVLRYTVEVLQIIQEGEDDLKLKITKEMIANKEHDVIDLVKREACKSPKLEENNQYLFMGLDKGGKYELDKTSFVKLWPTDPNDADKKKLDKFADQHKCSN